MDKRSSIGLGIMIVGFVLLIIGASFGFMGLLAVSIYALIFIVVGLVIMLNKSEDKIEEINYSKMKGGLKKKK
jgi:hypothetical protein